MRNKIGFIAGMLSMIILCSAPAFAKQMQSSIKVEDFSGLTEGAVSVPGFEISNRPNGGGGVCIKTIDDKFGKSLSVSAPTSADGDLSYISVPAGNSKGRMVLEFDASASGITNDYTFLIRYATSETKIMSFGGVSGTEWKIGSSSKGILQYEDGEWIHIKLIFDTYEKIYEIFMYSCEQNAEENEIPLASGSLSNDCINGIRNFRITSSRPNAVSYVAIDNIYSYLDYTIPEIVSIGYDDTEESEEIPYNAEKLQLNLSAPAYSEITTDMISMTDENGITVYPSEIGIENNGNRLEVHPAGELKSNNIYTVCLNENFLTKSGIPINEKVEKTFRTSCSAFDVKNVSFKNSDGKISAVPQFVNETGETKTAYIAMSIICDDVIKKTVVKKIIVNEDGTVTDDMELEAEYTTGDSIEFYAITSLKKAKMISSKIYGFDTDLQ